MLKRLLVLSFVFFGLILGLWPSTSSAHGEPSLAFSTISLEDGVIKYVLQLDLSDFQTDTGIEDSAIGEQTPGALDRSQKKSYATVEEYFLSNIQLYADGLPLKGKLTQLRKVEVEGENQPFAEAVLEYPNINAPQEFYLDYNLVFGRDGWHVNYVNVAIGDLKKEAVLVSDLRELRIGQMSLPYSLIHFFLLGLMHSFTGFISILFIISFILGCRSMKQFISILSVFFGLQALTFILASLQLVTLPDKFVHSIIAISIILTSLYTLFSKQKKFYFWLAGGTGFFSGFGFTEGLAGLRSEGGNVMAPLLAHMAGTILVVALIAIILYVILRYAMKVKNLNTWVLRGVLLFGAIWFIWKACL